MRADELKKLTQEAELHRAKLFWEDFKDALFAYLKQKAMEGNFDTTIGYYDIISEKHKGTCWICDKYLREKVTEELERLGYKCTFFDDREGEYMGIRWN